MQFNESYYVSTHKYNMFNFRLYLCFYLMRVFVYVILRNFWNKNPYNEIKNLYNMYMFQ